MVQVIQIGLAMVLSQDQYAPSATTPAVQRGGHVEGTACKKNQIPSHEHKLQLTRGIQETEKGIGVRFRHFACKTFSNAEQKPSRESIISVTV